ncbi:MAG: 4Fe-4S binding protein [bacterium]|nr:4Fe-4S binding protein [bacterium]
MKRLPGLGSNISRRDFLRISLAASAASVACPAFLTGCGTEETKKLYVMNTTQTQAHLKLVEFYSQKAIFGPPACQELLDLVVHLYTPEEAEIVQYLPLIYGLTASETANVSGKPLEEVQAILTSLAEGKRAVIVLGEGDIINLGRYMIGNDPESSPAFAAPKEPLRYGLWPIVPGTFEMILMSGQDDEWHRRYGELAEKLYNTGYIAGLLDNPINVVRYIPVYKTIKSSPMALPSDLLTELIRENSSFAVGFCACRQSTGYSGHDCGLPRETDMSTGALADFLVARNIQRRIDRSEALDIKMQANAAGLATFTINADFGKPNYTCSCCKCCCIVLRSITQFGAPGLIAPPHFRPQRDLDACVHCLRCQEKCLMDAHVYQGDGVWQYRAERCIGCGVCASVCPKNAITMEAVPNYVPPPPTYMNMAMQIAPHYAKHLKQFTGT